MEVSLSVKKTKIRHKISPLHLKFLERGPFVNSQFGTLSLVPRVSRVWIWKAFRAASPPTWGPGALWVDTGSANRNCRLQATSNLFGLFVPQYFPLCNKGHARASFRGLLSGLNGLTKVSRPALTCDNHSVGVSHDNFTALGFLTMKCHSSETIHITRG